MSMLPSTVLTLPVTFTVMFATYAAAGPGGTPTQVFNPANPAGLNPADPTIKLCPSQMWTQERGAVSPEQCCECSDRLG